MDLEHDAVAGKEGVADLHEREVDGVGLVGGEGLGSGEAVAELAAHGFAADELLVSGEEG